MGSSSSEQIEENELTIDHLPSDYQVLKPLSAEFKGLEIGDEVIRDVEGAPGCLLPGIFYHNGIYIGNGGVVSKYRDEENHTKGIIKLENLRSQDWMNWRKGRRGGQRARNKAVSELQEFLQRPDQEAYHLKTNNCQHFTDYCLAEGISSRPRTNP